MEETGSREISMNPQLADTGSSAAQSIRAIELYANLRDARTCETPTFDIHIAFPAQADGPSDNEGDLLIETWVEISESRQRMTGCQKTELESRLKTMVANFSTSVSELQAAINENKSTHNCEDRSCGYTAMIAKRLTFTLNHDADALRGPAASRQTTPAPSFFKVRLVAPVCPLAPPMGMPQDVVREHGSPETRHAFTNVDSLSARDNAAVCVLVRPTLKAMTDSSDETGGWRLPDFSTSVIATDSHGTAFGLEEESAAKTFIESALAKRYPTQDEWAEAEHNAPMFSSPEETLTQFITTLLWRHCSKHQDAADDEQRTPEMTVMVALAELPLDLARQ